MSDSSFSLMKMMRDDVDFIKRMEQKKANVKADIDNLSAAAKIYEKKYENVVAEGTREKQLLLEDGRRRGLTEEQTYGKMTKFIPAKDTPILNMLYFLMNEYENVNDDIQFLRENENVGKKFDDVKKMLNENHGRLTEKDIDQQIPDLLEYVYNNVTLDIFNTIKKLKALSNSPNENEAARAFIKGRELCKKYNLDFDRIPCNVEEDVK